MTYDKRVAAKLPRVTKKPGGGSEMGGKGIMRGIFSVGSIYMKAK